MNKALLKGRAFRGFPEPHYDWPLTHWTNIRANHHGTPLTWSPQQEISLKDVFFSSFRYIHTIYLGIQSRQSAETERWRYYWRMVYEFADVSMLHLLATFLESAPQLVLQLCIIIQTHKLQAVQGTSSLCLLLANLAGGF